MQEALAQQLTASEQEFVDSRQHRQAIGTPDEVREVLASLLASTRADELMLHSGAYSTAARERSLEIAVELFAQQRV
jgi:alkanesulfonate monooxygenase SsuD/methylene tetrahydromethanopterin reductase-like flavin-dependent oxidoreductase (luciferase family)